MPPVFFSPPSTCQRVLPGWPDPGRSLASWRHHDFPLLTIACALSRRRAADDLGRNDDLERRLYYTSFGTADKREGISAFLQKRKPRWTRPSRKVVAPPKAPAATPKKSGGYPLKPLVMLPRTIGRAALGKEIAPIPIAV